MNPLIKTLSIGAGGIAVAVAVYFGYGATQAQNYSGVILTHLVDIIQGKNTTTVVATNAPNWSIGEPLFTPISTYVASSSYSGTAANGLASSTVYYLAVAALDGTGTTTISNTVSALTDASTTQSKPEALNITWTPVIGATGYAVYYSSTTPALNYYFYATTTSRYSLGTEVGGIKTTPNTQQDTTAYSTLFNPVGPDYVNGNNGTATSSAVASTTAFQVNGNITATSQATTSACQASTVGQIFYNRANDILWLCKSAGWTAVK